MIHFEPPAILPGTLKEQLRALAPYMLKFRPKENGGFVIKMAIPVDILTGDLDVEFLRKHNLSLEISSDEPRPSCDGRIMIYPEYVDVTLTYL